MSLPNELQQASNYAVWKVSPEALNYTLTFLATGFSVLDLIRDDDAEYHDALSTTQEVLMFSSILLDGVLSLYRCSELEAYRRTRMDGDDNAKYKRSHNSACYLDYLPSIVGAGSGLVMAGIGISNLVSKDIGSTLKVLSAPFATLWHTVSSATIDIEMKEIEKIPEASLMV